jgi:hypothetical protein
MVKLIKFSYLKTPSGAIHIYYYKPKIKATPVYPHGQTGVTGAVV